MNKEYINSNHILVLGGAGFIGTNLCLKLLKNNESVISFDRPGTNMQTIISEGAIDKYGYLHDFKDNDFADNLLSSVDTVYHLVSTTCPTNSNLNIASEIEENVIATVHMLDACVRNNVKKVIFLSSGGTVYGKEHNGIVKEEDDACPISSYGIQKLTIEKILYLYHEIHGLDYRIVRLANPYGPYQRPNGIQGVVSTFTWKAIHNDEITIYGDGKAIRDYIYIDDAIEGILNISTEKASHKIYNLGSGQGLSVLQVTDAISKALDKKLTIVHTPTRPVDVPVNILNIDRYISDFGCPDFININDGIKRLADFYYLNE